MKVFELIEKLKDVPQDYDVIFLETRYDHDDIPDEDFFWLNHVRENPIEALDLYDTDFHPQHKIVYLTS